MLMYFVSQHNGNELCYSGEDQVGMQCFFIPGAAPGETEVFFDMVDVTFHNGTCFVGILPFFCSADSAGISSEMVVLLDIYHPSTARCCAGVFAVTMAGIFAGGTVVQPFHFGADKFIP